MYGIEHAEQINIYGQPGLSTIKRALIFWRPLIKPFEERPIGGADERLTANQKAPTENDWGMSNSESKMRRITLAILIAAGFGFVGASGASAAPANGAAIGELGRKTDQVIQVRESCGLGRHRNWGRCVPGCGPGWSQPYPEAHCRPR
jgi:hypothetical protein